MIKRIKWISAILASSFVVGITFLAILEIARDERAQAQAEGPVYCRTNAQYNANTSGSTRLIVGRTADRTWLCGFQLWSAGTVNVGFVYGTGTTCATGETTLTPSYSLTTQTGIADTSSVFRGLFVPPGQDVCIKTSGGITVQAQVFYVQR
jgi:hypothetical protein